ncbi:MAG: hypothetical protein SGJ15_00180 [Bacteroidota bacterium]|nr:hypothetical protein [Bacteroidota bacterium]
MKLIAFFILLGGFFIKAQQPSYIHFTGNNGLPSNTVYYCIQDLNGYFWFTTDKGVAKFNGYSFQNFSTNDGLSDNDIFDAYEDWQGRIWFSCSNGELSYYENGNFYNRSKSPLLSKINTSNLGLKVLSDNKKTIHYITQGLTVSIDSSLKIKQKKLIGQFANSTLLKNNLGDVISLNYDTSNVHFTNLTSGTQLSFLNDNRKIMPRVNTKADVSEGAVYYSTENKVIKKSFSGNRYEVLGEFESMVQYLKISDQNKLYIGTQKGLVIYDLLTHKRGKTLFPEPSISSILIDNENHLWITTLNDGIYLLLNEDVMLITKSNGLAFDKTLYLNFADSNTLFAGSNNFYCSFISETR